MQGADFGCEDEFASAFGDVQRLDAEPIAGKKEPPARRVPDGEGEHAVEAIDYRRAPFLIAVHERLGVRVVGAEDVPARLELRVAIPYDYRSRH